MAKKKEDNLLGEIRDSVNKAYKKQGGNVANIMDDISDDLSPSDWISTGDDILDLSISNIPNGGLPLGRYVNIYGDSGLGKSLLVAKIFANAQKKGGYGVYYDTENASFPPYMRVLGVDPKRLLYFSTLNTVEDIFESMIQIILSFKQKGHTAPLVIAVDSMTAVTTKKGADLDVHDKQGYGTGAEKQMLLGDELKKTTSLLKGTNILFITTDQVRDNFNAGPWASKTRSTTGHAQKFWSDIRLKMSNLQALKNSMNEKVGSKIQIETVKNRLAPPFRKTKHYIYNTHGIDNFASWIENGNEYGIIKKKAGGYIEIKDVDGNAITTEDGKTPRANDLKKLIRTDEKIRKMMYEEFCNRMIIKYNPQDDAVFEDLEELIDMNPDMNMSDFETTTEFQDQTRDDSE